jgi:P4 family phage/plasmid primase-like protien
MPLHTEHKTLNKFLLKHVVNKGDNKEITHTRIGVKNQMCGGSYCIPDEEYDSFMKLVFNDVIVNKKPEYLTEKQLGTNGPILVDFDFRYDVNVTQRIHTERHILDMVCLYLEEIKKIFQFEEDTHIPVYICEKPKVNVVEEKKYTKDGIHMIIGLKADHVCQVIIRKRIMSKISNIWGDLPLINTWDEVLDHGVSKGTTNWQLYGSKKPNNDAYALTHVYDITKDSVDDELIYKSIDPQTIETEDNFYKLSARYNKNCFLFMFNNFMEEYEGVTSTISNKNKFIPQQRSKNITSQDCDINNKEELNIAVQYFLESLKSDEYELRECYEYTMALPKSFYGNSSYDKWIRVGWALCNIDQKLFIVWIAFSAQHESFDFKDISDLWHNWQSFDSNNKSGLTKRSIMYWLKEEKPADFKKIMENTVDYHIDQTLERLSIMASDKGAISRGCGDYDIANILYHLYKEEYICAGVKGNLWYHFENSRWKEIEVGTSLRNSISTTLREVYHRKAIKMLNYTLSMTDEDKKVVIKKRIEIIYSIIQRLTKTNDKNNIMVEAKELFYDPTFFDKLDNNPYMICFKNGVIDFRRNEFRIGRPDDFMSKCTNINYVKLDTMIHSEKIDQINDFMDKLFPDVGLRRYMWEHLSSTLLGTCKEQTINMYIGIGQNGKSVLINLMEHVLGDYKGDVPLSLITQQRTKIGGLAPELVQLRGVRYAVIQEPSKGDKINEGIMKQMTGGDPVQARSPYMVSTLTYIPQFKLVVCSNELMEIKSQDHGTWRRIRICDFESLFTDNPKKDDKTRPYQFKLDKNIKEKFNSWKEIFASMMVEQVFKSGGDVNDCDKVLAASLAYRQSQDCIAEYLNTHIIINENSCLSKVTLSDKFREWYNVNHGGKPPTMRDVTVQADKMFGPCRDGLWVGVSMKLEKEFSVTPTDATISE